MSTYWETLGVRKTLNSGGIPTSIMSENGNESQLVVGPAPEAPAAQASGQQTTTTQSTDTTNLTSKATADNPLGTRPKTSSLPPRTTTNLPGTAALAKNSVIGPVSMVHSTSNTSTLEILPPNSSSTPATSPSNRIQDYRTPLHNETTEGDTSLFYGFDTPFGLGANHQLNDQPLVDFMNLPIPCDERQMSNYISLQKKKVDRLRDTIQDEEGWQKLFPKEGKQLQDEIENLLTTCKSNHFIENLAELYIMRTSLKENMDNLKQIVDRDNTISENTQLRASTLQTPTAVGSPPPGITPLSKETERNDKNNDKAGDSTITGRPKTAIDLQMGKMRELISDVNKIKANKTDLVQLANTTDTKMQELEINRITRTEYTSLCQRILALELEVKRTKDLDLETKIQRTANACNALKTVTQGICEDNLKISHDLERVQSQQTNFLPREPLIPTTTTNVPVVRSERNSRLYDTMVNTISPNLSGMLISMSAPNLISSTGPTISSASSMNYLKTRDGYAPTQAGRQNPQNTYRPVVPQPGTIPRQATNNTPLVPQPGTSPRLASNSRPTSGEESPQCLSDQNSSESCGDTFSLRRRARLLESSENLKSLCPQINSELSKTRVIGLQKSTLPLVMNEKKELSRELEKYARSDLIDEDAITKVENIISEASKWCSSLMKKYEELDCGSRPVDSKLFQGLEKFTENSEISIYEFLKKFDTIMEDRGTKKERAIILYTQYLDSTIQLLTTDIRENIDGLKSWLVKRYGEPRGMCTNILKPLKKESIPSAITLSNELLHYSRLLDAAVKRVKELNSLPGMPLEKLNTWIQSTDFLEQLASLLPDKLLSEMYQKLKDKELDMQNLHGKETFSVITDLISSHASMIEGMAKIGTFCSSAKPRSTKEPNPTSRRAKSAHLITEDWSSNSDTESTHSNHESAHFSSNSQQNKGGKTSKRNSETHPKNTQEKKTKSKSKEHFTFPCCYPGHSHELGECSLFFSFSSRKRKLVATGKTCYTCLKPFETCKDGCKSNVPQTLICQPCTKNAANKGKSYPPTNVLLCPMNKHKENISEKDVLTALKDYLKNFNPDQMADSISINHLFLSAHATSSCSKCKTNDCSCTIKSLSRTINETEETPNLDTSTGQDVKVNKEKIIEEINEDAFYVMQLLNLRGRDVLTFYDSGANQNMIKGEIAEDINLKVLNQRPIHVGVVGGGKVWTNYGTYGFSLGPTEDGFYYNLSAQGITSITSKFPQYNLDQLNRDTMKSKKLPTSTPLPKYIGGQEAGLLVGIKNVGLDPELLFQLPSGLGVFTSPLKDKFGSRICYGGPSHIFTDVNNKMPSFNHASMYFANLITQYRNSPYPTLSRTMELDLEEPIPGIFMTKQIQPSSKITTNHQELYTSALDEDDMNDLGTMENHHNELKDSDCICGNELTQAFISEDRASLEEAHPPRKPKDNDHKQETDQLMPNGPNHPTDDDTNQEKDYGKSHGNEYKANGKTEHDPWHEMTLAQLKGITKKASTFEAYKVNVPISKRRDYIDSDDLEHSTNTRCEDCIKCKKCSFSNKSRMISLQEQMEQEAIEKSVTVDMEAQEVRVDLPFIKNPVEYMKKRHYGANSNVKQATKVYKSQCKKPIEIRNAITIAHKELVDKGFMVKRKDLPEDLQHVLNKAEFLHYMPWHIAAKEGSLSTPYRMVVDASMTGLNEILAKGENKMSKISDILIRNRCNRFIWSSDISKLYNQLKLKPSALPWGLFLFKEGLDPNTEPEEYVMKAAWYGVSPTGNQSHVSLDTLTIEQKDTYPEAYEVVRDSLYVDDVFAGTNNHDETTKQIQQTSLALGNGGFNLKYIVRSGEVPCTAASTDQKSLKVLGYKWSPEEDILQPGFGEINFNKRKKGSKKPNTFPVETPDDITEMIKTVKITRRIVASKVAELWDPTGLWEPYKLQLKLDNQALKGLSWDTELDNDLQVIWTERFKEMLEIPHMFVNRCIVPPDAVDPNNLRLVCISDAGMEAGGCAIYGGFLKTDGTYSSSLLLAKSKLMSQKVPRNELDAIKLMAENADSVKSALGSRVSDTIYFTDSTIAMCWCHSVTKKMRMYTLFRVAEIRRLILGATHPQGGVTLPLYHIDGKLNIADLLTKRHNTLPRHINGKSLWQEGYDWMKLPLTKMTITTYDNLKLSKQQEVLVDEECFPEAIMSQAPQDYQSKTAFFSHCNNCNINKQYTPQDICFGNEDESGHCNNCSCPTTHSFHAVHTNRNGTLVDIIAFGWKRSVNILSYVHKFALLLKHQVHISKGILKGPNCKQCLFTEDSIANTEVNKMYVLEAKNYLFRVESEKVKSIIPDKKLKSFTLKDGIFYYESRLTEEIKKEDLDYHIFFDNHEIKELLPVVLANSDLFFALVIHIHHFVRPHSGVEITMKESLKIVMPINNPRKIIQRIRQDCPKCRMISKKTTELRMMNHPAARSTIAPPFYICQADTVFGFRAQTFKNARKVVKIYALIICCLLTGATNILTLEGLETRDILQALERHGSRYGMPSTLYVDNGTQLIALDNATFSLKDLNNKVQDSFGMKVIVSNAKAHEERGRVESRVKILRNMLEKFSINTDIAISVLQWETIFARVSNTINDVPIAKCTQTKVSDPGWDIITPNRLMLGRNNQRCLEGHITLSKGVDSEHLLRKIQNISKTWYLIFTERIHHLIPRPSKWNKSDDIRVGDICLFMYNENPGLGKNTWKLGRVQTIPKKNKVILAFPGPTLANGVTMMKTLTRNPRDISIISAAGDIDMNSRKYLESICGGK